MGSLLKSLDLPDDLKALDPDRLKQLAREIRHYIIKIVSDNGGHLAPNLGVVELTLALHSTFNSPEIRLSGMWGIRPTPTSWLPGGWIVLPLSAVMGA